MPCCHKIYDTDTTVRYNAVRRADNATPCHRTGYEKHNVHTSATHRTVDRPRAKQTEKMARFQAAIEPTITSMLCCYLASWCFFFLFFSYLPFLFLSCNFENCLVCVCHVFFQYPTFFSFLQLEKRIACVCHAFRVQHVWHAMCFLCLVHTQYYTTVTTEVVPDPGVCISPRG